MSTTYADPAMAGAPAMAYLRCLGGIVRREALRFVHQRGRFLSALVNHPRFRAGKLTTGFIAEAIPSTDAPRAHRKYGHGRHAAAEPRRLVARPAQPEHARERGHEERGVRFHALRSRRAGRRAFVSVHVLVPGDWSLG